MAKRYSGEISMLVTLRSDDSYSVSFAKTWAGVRENRLACPPIHGVRLAPVDAQRLALDSAEAYDKIACAAISFADHEHGCELFALCETNESGEVLVSRSRQAS